MVIRHWNEVKILDTGERWKVRRLKESRLGMGASLVCINVEFNSIWEPLKKNDRQITPSLQYWTGKNGGKLDV